MSKKCRLTVPFNKQHGKRARTLFKSERRQFYHIYWLLWKQLSLKKSLLVICKILRLFVNTFAAYDKDSNLNKEYLTQLLHIQMSRKQKLFLDLFLQFWNLDYIFNIFKKKMTLRANVFLKVPNSKNVVR